MAEGVSSRPPSYNKLAHLNNVTGYGNIIWWPRSGAEATCLWAWVGDHSPRHVHVFRDGKLVVKWDLDNWQPMKGQASAWVVKLLEDLVKEKKL